ncbi:MAG: sigma-70 family RNA polymerase sigma factor [Planctomycetota bacterium]|nr:MAG: sigma-70 family RNA polymerase sigma factor [Planctomycetota bacterium]
MAEATCWTLIEGAAAGDSAARTEFTHRYLPVIRAYLHARWKDRLLGDELQDAVQEVFVECLREDGVLARAGSGDRRGFRAYLFGVVRNVALRVESARVRVRDAAGQQSFHAEQLPIAEASLSRIFDRAWATSLLGEAVQRQSLLARDGGPGAEKRVELLRLVFQEGRSLADIARDWNAEPRAIYSEYERAQADFLRALKQVVAFHHPGAPESVGRECRELLAMFR